MRFLSIPLFKNSPAAWKPALIVRAISSACIACGCVLLICAPAAPAQSTAATTWTVSIVLPPRLVAGQPATLAVLGVDGRLVVRFTTQVVLDATPDEETFAAMHARFTTAEITQLLLVIGQYMMVARVMATAQLEVDAVLGGDVLAGIQQARSRREASS